MASVQKLKLLLTSVCCWLSPFSDADTSTATDSSRSWRLANSGPAPSSGTWSVYELDFFRNYAVGPNNVVHCHDEFEPTDARILSSGFLNFGDRFAPENAFEDLVEIGKGWNSQLHRKPFKAWIGLEFSAPVEVTCVRLYQSGLKHKRWGRFDAQSVALQKFSDTNSSTDDGIWQTVYTWNSSAADALPGWTWITLAVGRAPSHAFTECPTATHPRLYKTCCVWPHLAVPGFVSANKLEFDERNVTIAQRQCSPLATVSSGRACKIQSTHCKVTGEIRCMSGKVHISMGDSVADAVLSRLCVEAEIKAVKHGGSPVALVDYGFPGLVKSSENVTSTKTTTALPATANAAQAWRLANGGPPPSSGHWVVHQLIMFRNFTVDTPGNIYCHDELDASAARIVSSGFMNYLEQFRPENAFDMLQIGQGWKSQMHNLPFEAWIGLEFSVPADVKCIRLYQSGFNTTFDSFGVQNVVLQRFAMARDESAPVDGDWQTVATWGVPGQEVLPGATWLTLPVGSGPSHAFTECTVKATGNWTVENRPWYRSCCIWPRLSVSNSDHLGFDQNTDAAPHCSPLATVSEYRSCAVRSTACGAVGQMTCDGGQVKLSFQSTASWLDVGGRCIQREFEQIEHAGSPLSFYIENMSAESSIDAPINVHRHWLLTIFGGFVAAFLVLGVLVWFILWWRSSKHQTRSAYGELELQGQANHAEENGMPRLIGLPVRYMRLK